MTLETIIKQKMQELDAARKERYQAEEKIRKLTSEIEGLKKIKQILEEHPDLADFIQISIPEVTK